MYHDIDSHSYMYITTEQGFKKFYSVMAIFYRRIWEYHVNVMQYIKLLATTITVNIVSTYKVNYSQSKISIVYAQIA